MFLMIQFPVLSVELSKRIHEYYMNSHLNYIDVDVLDALLYLKKQPHAKNALAFNTLETLVPVISGHTVYVGSSTLTFDYVRKISETFQFYSLKLPPDQAQLFLKNNNIGYVIWSRNFGDYHTLISYYPFLHIEYINSAIVIFNTF